MEKDTKINIIDYSCSKTMSRGGDYNTFDNIYSALKTYFIDNNSGGFTRLDDARSNIESLTKDDIKVELLKNIVKKEACSNYYNYMRRLNTKKSFDDPLDTTDAELLIFKSITDMSMDEVEEILNKYPKLNNLLIDSFVSSRYFDDSYKIDNLEDKSIMTNEYNKLIEKIDSYYKGKNN